MALLPARVPKSHPSPTLASGAQREEKSANRITLRIIRCGARLLDRDNLYASPKQLIDCLRDAKLIPDDDEASIELIVEQVKEKRRDHRGTQIIIEYPDEP